MGKPLPKPVLPPSFDAVKQKSPSQKMRAVIWRWWKYEHDHGITTLTSEQFYEAKMREQIKALSLKFPNQ